jgi:hypothetical protein
MEEEVMDVYADVEPWYRVFPISLNLWKVFLMGASTIACILLMVDTVYTMDIIPQWDNDVVVVEEEEDPQGDEEEEEEDEEREGIYFYQEDAVSLEDFIVYNNNDDNDSSSSEDSEESEEEETGWSMEMPEINPMASKTKNQLLGLLKEKDQQLQEQTRANQRLKRKLQDNQQELQETKKYKIAFQGDRLLWITEIQQVLDACILLLERNQELQKSIPLCKDNACANPVCRTLARYRSPDLPQVNPPADYSNHNLKLDYQLCTALAQKLDKENSMLQDYLTASTEHCNPVLLAQKQQAPGTIPGVPV